MELKQRAKEAEARKDIAEAVKLYLQARDVNEAARVYMNAGRFDQAGRLLFRAVGLPLDQLSKGSHEQRKLAVSAAICLARANETHNAVSIYIALGDKKRAIETLEKAGDAVGAAKLRVQLEGGGDGRPVAGTGAVAAAKYNVGMKLEQEGDLPGAMAAYIQAKAFADAGRIARKLGKPAEAGPYFEEAGMYFEAAVCWNEAQDQRRCLDALVRIPRDHPKYRGCAVRAIGLAAQFGEVGFELDQFLSRFLSTGPENAGEIDSFVAIGKLYAKHGLPENARECFKKILAVAPDHPVGRELEGLERDMRGSNMAYDKVMREDAAFHRDTRTTAWGKGAAAQLPDLPDLPDLPPMPGQPAAPPARTAYGMGQAPMPPGYPQQGYPQQGYPQQGYPQQPPPGYPGTAYGYAPGPQGYPPQAPQPQGMPPGHGAPPPGYPHGTSAGYAPTMTPQNMPQAGQVMAAVAGQPAPAAHVPSQPSLPQADVGPLDLTPGQVIAERYKIEKQIGQGGTASVFRVSDLELEEVVALKLFTVIIDDPDLIRRFKQELSVARKLSHPNIVRLHDIGMHRGFRFLTMELLSGTDLAGTIAAGNLTMTRSLDFLIQACHGLQVAHDRGIVHRDIKPENFFVTEKNVLKVMDFGIAKNAQATKRTQAGFIAGTPPYMSPEQISGFADVSHLADIYSLGIVAYEMFAGSLPFVHEEMMPLLMMHLTQAPEPPSTHNPSIPKPLNELILRLLAKDPKDRIQSCKQLAEELTKLRSVVASAER
jgi:serine/threonine-protein kinase